MPTTTEMKSTTVEAEAFRPRLLQMKDVAEQLGVSVQRAYELARTGLIPVVHIGRQIRVEEGRLRAWIRDGGRALPGGWKRDP